MKMDLPPENAPHSVQITPIRIGSLNSLPAVHRHRIQILTDALAITGGNRTYAARLLKVHYITVRKWMKAYGLDELFPRNPRVRGHG